MLTGKIVKKIKLNGEDLIIRYPRFEDVDGLLKLFNSLVEEKAIISVQKKLTTKQEIKYLLDVLERVEDGMLVYLVVEYRNEIVGEADIRRFLEASQTHLGLMDIALKKNIRGQGIGKLLLDTVIKEAQKRLKLTMIELEVFSNNKIAQKVYKKAGFVQTGRMKNGVWHYNKFVDEITMVKYLG